jgi:hypothetical protein
VLVEELSYDPRSPVRTRRRARPATVAPTRRRNLLPHEDISSEDDDPRSRPAMRPPRVPPSSPSPSADAVTDAASDASATGEPNSTASECVGATTAHHTRRRIAKGLHFGASLASLGIAAAVLAVVPVLVTYFYQRPSDTGRFQGALPLDVFDVR